MMTQREHVYGLGTAFNVKVVERPEFTYKDSFANVRGREIHVARLDDDESYAAALHEMGHVLAPGGNLRNGEVRPTSRSQAANYTLFEEAAAWTWARHAALGWNDAMQRAMKTAFATYEKDARKEAVDEVDAVVAKAILPTRTFVGGDAAAFFKAGSFGKRPSSKPRRPVTDMSKVELSKEYKEFLEAKKMLEALFAGALQK